MAQNKDPNEKLEKGAITPSKDAHIDKNDNSMKTEKPDQKKEQRKAIMQSHKIHAKKVNPEDVYHTIRFMEDVPLKLQAEAARTELPLRNILSWKPGSIIKFNKIIGEPMEILIGEQLIARGEVVVINNRYGIRISEITRPDEKVGDIRS